MPFERILKKTEMQSSFNVYKIKLVIEFMW
jgi:hypothetical protein